MCLHTIQRWCSLNLIAWPQCHHNAFWVMHRFEYSWLLNLHLLYPLLHLIVISFRFVGWRLLVQHIFFWRIKKRSFLATTFSTRSHPFIFIHLLILIFLIHFFTSTSCPISDLKIQPRQYLYNRIQVSSVSPNLPDLVMPSMPRMLCKAKLVTQVSLWSLFPALCFVCFFFT